MLRWARQSRRAISGAARWQLRGSRQLLGRLFPEDSLRMTALIAAGVFGLHHAMFLLPELPWLPDGGGINAFLKILWQVHASVLALSAVVVTVIVTLLANEQERAQTWDLYRARTGIGAILRFNLLLLVSEGLAVAQTLDVEQPLIAFGSTQGVIFAEGLMFGLALALLGFLLLETFRFLDPAHVDDILERRIKRSIQRTANDDIDRRWAGSGS